MVLRIALAQINVMVGDIEGNTQRVLEAIERARSVQADLVVFPELVIPGYPPEDLLFKVAFLRANRAAVEAIAPATRGLTALVGFADFDDDIYNAAAVLHDGALAGVYRKHYLPTYSVFDEDRYFRAGSENLVFVRDGVIIGVSICEDIWYPAGPPEAQAVDGGAHLLVNLSASPYHIGKGAFRERMLAIRAADNEAFVAFCNLVGGQDELVFDGESFLFDPRGELIARGAQFEEDFIVADLEIGAVFRQRLHDPRQRKERTAGRVTVTPLSPLPSPEADREPLSPPPPAPRLDRLEEVYRALVLGTRDYVRKNGFRQVVIGLSGGIDSSLVACIAADALGPENVTGVSMPSRYSAEMSRTDAARLADNLGIHFLVIPIESIFQSYLETLADPFAGLQPDVTEENIQARIRGNLLMALSNKFGWLVLTTGNKSEMSVGYATLYGDMAGGFAVIKDVPKTLVYELARWRNARPDGPVIPERVLTRPPSAELRPDQKDTDSLPPYEVLDPILHAYVEEDRSLEEIMALGYPEELVEEVIRMVDRSEYKRRQAPPGVRITRRAFGKDRRLPITNRWSRG
ncbi:MAG TPA: NAD+ synthase [Chloroflexi bacterium]|nr:NAD+ synthase [Chloroflexota bacterium]